MLRFYYSKGSSAVAAHILLEEVCAAYDAIEVSIAAGAHQQEAFLRIAPKGRIPVLQTREGVLTENPAILEHIARSHPDANLMPVGVFAQAKAHELCAFLSATAHVAFAHLRRPSRWAVQASSQTDMADRAPYNLADCASFLENDLALAPWAFGEAMTYCDAYVFQFTRWLEAAGVDVTAYTRLSAHRAAMLPRPAVQKVLDLHGI